MFFIKEEQLCGYLPPLALFLYPVLPRYLRSNAGAAEVSEAQFLMVGAHCFLSGGSRMALPMQGWLHYPGEDNCVRVCLQWLHPVEL